MGKKATNCFWKDKQSLRIFAGYPKEKKTQINGNVNERGNIATNNTKIQKIIKKLLWTPM